MKNSLFYGIMACACLAWACKDDGSEETPSRQEAPLVIAAEAYSFDPQAAGEVWNPGRSAGVFLVDHDTKEVVEPYRNVKYAGTTRPTGYFSPENPDEVVRLSGRPADAVLYAPYRADMGTLCPMDLLTQQGSLAGFLYGRGDDVTCSDNRRQLALRPVLSQLVFEVAAGEGVTDDYLEGVAVAVEGACTKADFNLATGTFENGGDVRRILLAPAASGRGASGLLFPAATVGGDLKATIDLPRMNRSEEWFFHENLAALEPGMRYRCTVRVSQQRIEVTTQAEAIGDWDEGGSVAGSGAWNGIRCLIEDLPLGPLAWVHNNNALSQTAEGDWFGVTNGNAADGKILATVETDPVSGRNVIRTVFSTASWYQSYLCHRMAGGEARIHSISFRARGTAGRQIRCYLKNNYGGNTVFVNSPAEGAAHAGMVGFTLESDWREYTLTYDLRKISTNGVNTPAAAHILDATEKALADFFIGFYALTADTEFYLDDIAFRPENQ